MNRKLTATERKLLRKDEAKLLAHIAEIDKRNRRYAKAKQAGGPEVGIFWLKPDGRILMDGTPVRESEKYGDLVIFSGTHTKLWDTFQRNGIVPPDVDYDEWPRGRVSYDPKRSGKFYLFADPCILKDKAAISKIMNDFKLPTSQTKQERDEHYRCPNCMRRVTKKQEEEDWDF